MNTNILGGKALEELAVAFDGRIVLPDDEGYDDARTIYNAMIDKRPAAIAQCDSVDDVRSALAFARSSGIEVAVRSGGHSVAGASLVDGGLVIDMRRMNSVTVDPGARTAIVGGGATWSDVDKATQPHGLAMTGGRVSTTGVAGLTLGGGSGWLERKFGLACDNLLSVDIVTADGRLLTASEREHPDLFWALHGGGGNFGIATSFTFRVEPLPAVTAALLLWPADAGRSVAARYRDFAQNAPDEIGGGLLYVTGPPEEFVPEHLVGKLTCLVLVTYAGEEAAARELIEPLLELSPDAELIMELPYAELQCMLDDPPGFRNYWSAEYLGELPDQALDCFCARAEEMIMPSPSQLALLPWGGQVARNAGSSAIANRDANWVVHPFGLWESPDDDDRAKRWARDVCADLKPYATGGVYLNFIGDEGEDRVLAGYGQANYDRLAAVKAQYDPENTFRRNHNVQPSPAPGSRGR